jgi:hypothetical protein
MWAEKSISILNLLVALSFALLVWSINWEGIRGAQFADRTVTARVLESNYYDVDIRMSVESIVFNLTHETLWNQGIRFLIHDKGIQISTIFSVISFLTVFVFSVCVVSQAGIWYLLFLINPLVIDLAFSQMRFSLAITILYLTASLDSRYLKLLLALCAFFIHTASVLIVFSYLICELTARQRLRFGWSTNRVFFSLTIVALMLVLLMGPVGNAILKALGDRRADYINLSSGAFITVFWFLYLSYYGAQIKTLFIKPYAMLSYLFILLFVLLSVFDMYGSRFLALAYPLIIVTASKMTSRYKIGVILTHVLYGLTSWTYWIS